MKRELKDLYGPQAHECGIGGLYSYELSGDTLRFLGDNFVAVAFDQSEPISELILSHLRDPDQIYCPPMPLNECYSIKVAHSDFDGYHVTIINAWDSEEYTFVCGSLDLIERYYTAAEATEILQRFEANHIPIQEYLDSIKEHIPDFEYKSNMD
jgi:hypothetical protein